MTTIRTTLCALGVASVLSGCTLMPRYTRPDAPVPAQFAGTDVSAAPPAATADSGSAADAAYIADIGWRQVFTDPALQQVIALALDNNRDLRVAALNIEVARAQYRVDRAALLPAIEGTGTANNARTPSELAIPGQPQVFRTYSANIGVSAYELD
ncbi:TolC family protein, partial [Xanthomonas perforans]